MDADAELRRKRLGRRGEQLAAVAVRLRGMRVLARNVRVRGCGEVDVLARAGSTLVLVEVKARRGGGGEEAVGPVRQRALRRCAERLLAEPGYGWAQAARFDVAAVEGIRVRYLPSAF